MIDTVADGKGRRLGRAVAVDEIRGRASAFEHGTRGRGIERVAADHEVAQRAEVAGNFARKLVEERRGEEEDRHAPRAQLLDESARRKQCFIRQHDQPRAIQQRAPDFKCRRVEGRVRHLRDDIVRGELNVVGIHHEPADAAMQNRGTLWLPGRAGREHDVGDIVARRRQVEIGGVFEREIELVDLHGPCGGARQSRDNFSVREHDGRLRVGEHQREPFRGIRRIERNISAACFHDREQ